MYRYGGPRLVRQPIQRRATMQRDPSACAVNEVKRRQDRVHHLLCANLALHSPVMRGWTSAEFDLDAPHRRRLAASRRPMSRRAIDRRRHARGRADIRGTAGFEGRPGKLLEHVLLGMAAAELVHPPMAGASAQHRRGVRGVGEAWPSAAHSRAPRAKCRAIGEGPHSFDHRSAAAFGRWRSAPSANAEG